MVSDSRRSTLLVFAPALALPVAGALVAVSGNLRVPAVVLATLALLASLIGAAQLVANATELSPSAQRRWYLLIFLLPFLVGPLILWGRLAAPSPERPPSSTRRRRSARGSYYRFIDATMPYYGALMLIGGFIALLASDDALKAGFAVLVGAAILLMRAWEHQAVARQREARLSDLGRERRGDHG